MHLSGKTSLAALLGVLVFTCQLCIVVSSSASTDQSTSTNPTCPSRTINYITETLPQQCLRTDWSRNGTMSEEQNGVELDNVEAGLITIDQPGDTAESSQAKTHSQSGSTAENITSQGPSLNPHTATVSVSVETVTSAATEVVSEQESDPLSDNANFLSFEEWKAQMLKKAGQSAEDIGVARQGSSGAETRRRPVGVNQALDSLGDDTEIELDFSGFVNPESISDALPSAKLPSGSVEKSGNARSDQVSPRSKEAGTTSKERFNYASFDCAATILKTNKECKGSTSILLENKDSYMLNPCSVTNKYFIVELCNDILIDTIALGNYEFFSSTFRTFRVSISDRYPVKPDKWREIGTFEARNTRGVQAFLVENGLIWARYLRIETLTHYGIEHYCPISILRVHGKTMIDDYRNDVKAARGEDDIDEDVLLLEEGKQDVKVEKIAPLSIEPSPSATDRGEPTGIIGIIATTANATLTNQKDPEDFRDKCPRTNYISTLVQQADLLTSACNSQRKYCNLELTTRINTTSRTFYKSQMIVSEEPQKSSAAETPGLHTAQSTAVSVSQEHPNTRTNASTETVQHDDTSTSAQGQSSTTSATSTTNTTNSAGNTAESASHTHSKPIPPPPAAPPTQESFFKSVHKRLQLLEANSTLSLQYIEEQSRILREAFTKVEKRQLNKTTTFLESLNATVLGELREFRLQYDQIWQSTILELSSQREASQREALALSARLTILAEEILWQKRLVYLQFGLILLCLGLIMFSRSNAAPYLELPVLQGVVQRSAVGFSRHFGLESPPGTPSRPPSRYSSFFSRRQSHFRTGSGDTAKSPSPGYQSPTPVTDDDREEREVRELRVTESPGPPEPALRRAISSPALVRDEDEPGTDDNTIDSVEVDVAPTSGGDPDSASLDVSLSEGSPHS